jgi:hypothetical protein
MLKKLFVTLVVIFAILPYSHAEFAEGKNAVMGNLGFTRGGMTIAGEFENGYDRTYGIGGYFRMVQDEDNPLSSGYTTIGAFIRPHFNRANWDFFVSPGFGLVFYEPGGGADKETLIGPSLTLGLLYEFNTSMSFGFDVFEAYSWFGEEDYRGELTNSAMTLKFRFIL